MDKEKKHQIATIIGAGLFILGLILSALRASDIIQHKIVDAKIKNVEEYNSECRRVSGKYGSCLNAKVEVEYPINKSGELRTGNITVEHSNSGIKQGNSIKVMFLDGKPDTVKFADFSSGWKGPLGVFFLGSLILIVSRATKSNS